MGSIKQMYEEGQRFIKEEEKRYKKEALEYFTEKEGEVMFDWDRLFKKRRELNYSGRRIFESLWDASLQILKERGYLVFPGENSFFIMGSGMDLSPTDSSGTRLYFKREREAEECALAEYKNALYAVSICEVKRNGINKR